MRITDEKRLAWGRALTETLRSATQLHAIVQERIDKQEKLNERLATALAHVNQESAQENETLSALTAASEDTAKKLRLIAIKLEQAHLEGKVEDEPYRAAMTTAYPQGTGVVGGTPGDRHAAAQRVLQALTEHASIDPDGELGKIAKEQMAELERRNEAAKKEAAEKQQAHEQLGQARVAWDEGYQATKEILSGLLRDVGRHAELPSLFPDLQ